MTPRVRLNIISLLLVSLVAFGCSKKKSPSSPPADTTPPEVVSVHPSDGQTGVPVDDSIIVVFSEPVFQPQNTQGLFHLGPATDWTSDFRQDTIVFSIPEGLLPGTAYEATITSSIQDEAGNSLGSDYVWTFTTEPELPGIVWTKHELLLDNSLTSIAKSDDVYIAVGTGGLVVRSTDGDTWNVIESPTVSDLHRVIWADTLFIAVGDSELIMTSTDGLDWIVRRSGNPARTMYAVVYTGELYVAVGGHFTLDQSMLADVRTSTNAIDWTPESLDQVGCMNSIVWTGSRFVATGFVTVDTYAIWTSDIGHDWSLTHTVPAFAAHYEDVAWSGSVAIAIGFDQSQLLYSSDGLKWNVRELAQNHSSRAIVWTGSQFISVGHFGHIFRSLDGIAWTSLDSGVSSDLYGVWGSFGSLAAVGGNIVLTSP